MELARNMSFGVKALDTSIGGSSTGGPFNVTNSTLD